MTESRFWSRTYSPVPISTPTSRITNSQINLRTDRSFLRRPNNLVILKNNIRVVSEYHLIILAPYSFIHLEINIWGWLNLHTDSDWLQRISECIYRIFLFFFKWIWWIGVFNSVVCASWGYWFRTIILSFCQIWRTLSISIWDVCNLIWICLLKSIYFVCN